MCDEEWIFKPHRDSNIIYDIMKLVFTHNFIHSVQLITDKDQGPSHDIVCI